MTEPIGSDGAPPGGDRFAHVNPASVWDSTRFGFSQAVVSPPGRIAWVSGLVRPELKVEIEATAVLPEPPPDP